MLNILKHRCKVVLDSALDAIGNTPMIPLTLEGTGKHAKIFGKLEFMNPSGSVKDRIGKFMIEQAERRGILKKDSIIVEATSGNTGIAMSMVGAAKGYKVVIIMPEYMSQERIKIMRALGAKVILTPKKGGFLEPVRISQEMAARNPKIFLPCQFSNPDNTECHYQTTGQEILTQCNNKVDAFVAGIGTGGTIMGVAKALREINPKVKIVAVEPTESAVMSGETDLQPHEIAGIGDGFIPEIVNMAHINDVVKVKSTDAIRIAKRFIREQGLMVGVSSGANFYSALKTAKKLGPGKTVVTVLPDRMERYFSTNLFK